jgi:hypothetical protein
MVVELGDFLTAYLFEPETSGAIYINVGRWTLEIMIKHSKYDWDNEPYQFYSPRQGHFNVFLPIKVGCQGWLIGIWDSDY